MEIYRRASVLFAFQRPAIRCYRLWEPPHKQQATKWGEKYGGLPAVQYVQAETGDSAAYAEAVISADSMRNTEGIKHFRTLWLGTRRKHRGKSGTNPDDVHG